jgi:F-type H+-transporting ATPase subunit b
MEYYLTQFAATEASSEGGIFGALGIDVTTLVLQAVAFLILVWLLGKFVYPVLIKTLDERQAKIEESTQAADEAKQAAENAEQEVAKLLVQARKEAKDIVATAKDEATAAIEAAEAKAGTRAEKIVASAKEQIEKDVIAAQKTLHNQTIDLVASATEKILGQSVDGKLDQKVVTRAIEEAK